MPITINLVRPHPHGLTQLWSSGAFAVNTPYAGWLVSEQKQDEFNLGATRKVDLHPGAEYWARFVEVDPSGTLRLQIAFKQTSAPPWPDALVIRPGVSLLTFQPVPPEPEPPQPEPPEPEPPEPEPPEPEPPQPEPPEPEPPQPEPGLARRVIVLERETPGIVKINDPTHDIIIWAPKDEFAALWQELERRILAMTPS